jgi:hypothetical protein
MYIHRIVIDANCINAKGHMAEMNELERYYAVGAIEILKTSTLDVEFEKAPRQAIKAEKYRRIGGVHSYIAGEHGAQSQEGTCIRPSLCGEIYAGIFGDNLTGKAHRRSLRDALHIDQAQMNGADMFVTDDIALKVVEDVLRTRSIFLAVRKPGESLEFLKQYFRGKIGTDDPAELKAQFDTQGPIILGSNTSYGCVFVAAPTQEELLRLEIKDGRLCISALFRDEHGSEVIRFSPGQRPEIFGPVGDFDMYQMADGPILAGDLQCSSLVVRISRTPIFAVRVTHSARVVIYVLLLRDSGGNTVAEVRGAGLSLSGAVLLVLGH